MPVSSLQRSEAAASSSAAPHGRPRWQGTSVVTLGVVGAVLYFGQDILVPFALAALLAFVLDPLVGALRRLGLPRAPAVALVMAGTVLVLAATSLFVAGQLTQLAKDLPTYQSTVQAKLRALRHAVGHANSLDGAVRMLDTVGGEIAAVRRDIAGSPSKPAPMRVSLEPAPRSALQSLGDLVTPVLGPLGTAGAVLLFLMFVLLERHDMRDRLLRLAGGNLHLSTDALGEAAQRVSRYLTMQLLVNLSYGLPLGLGLWLIGVPGAVLWGLVGAMLRFVPYVGPVIAAVFPLTLAFAVDPGWQMVLWTLALVATLELIVNNLIEPWLYGASTGLSALAIIVSAMAWTLLWGPVGLILATPLTVCLAVLGRHLPQLAWLDVLLGSAPVFDAPTRLYQRLLAGDVEEAIELCETQLRSNGLLACYSATAVPALALAARDHLRSASVEHRHRVSTGMAELLHSLREDHPAAPASGLAASPRVLCVGARSELDTLAADLLSHALEHAGWTARVLPSASIGTDRIHQLDLSGVDVLCVSSFSATPEAKLRYIARRLRRRHPGLHIVAGLWSAPVDALDPDADDPDAPRPADAVAGTLAEAVQHVGQLLAPAAATDTEPPVPSKAIAAAATAGARELAAERAAAQASTPGHEDQRVTALHASGALAPELQPVLDRAALRAADIFGVPCAMVTLVDRDAALWQGAVGLDDGTADAGRQHPRQVLLCEEVLASGAPLVIDDIDRDPLRAEHPMRSLLPLRFYAGAPLVTLQGQLIGTLCLIDVQPRHLSARENRLLLGMAQALMAEIAQHPSAQASLGRAAEAAAAARLGTGPRPPQPPATVSEGATPARPAAQAKAQPQAGDPGDAAVAAKPAGPGARLLATLRRPRLA